MIPVLYVDDERSLLDVGKIYLEKTGGITVETTTSAIRALELIRTGHYDAVVSDYQMPDMDGIAFLKILRREFPDLPFIIFTGRGREEVVIQALNEGADFYLQKGGEPQSQFAELSNKIRYAVKRRHAEEALRREEEELRKKNEELNTSFEQITAVEEELRSNLDDLAWQGQALRESEERYRNVVEDQTEFISRFLPDGTHVFVNEAYCRYFGRDRTEILGHHFQPKIPAGDLKRVNRFLACLTRDNPVDTIEHRIILPDGAVRWQRWSDRAIFDNEGHIREYQSVGMDITDRKHAEYELRAAYEQLTAAEEELRTQYDELKDREQAIWESERKLQEIVQGSPIPQFVIDKNHRIISWNRALEDYSGVKATEVIGTTHAWKAFYDRERPVLSNLLVENEHEKIRELYAGKYNRSKYVDGAYEVTDFFPRMGRHGIWLYYTAAVLRDSSGTIVGAVETLEDITDRKNAELELQVSYEQITTSEEELRHQCDELKKGEDALRESEMRYRLLTECMKDVIWQMDADMTFTYISPSVLQQCGYTPEEVVGRKLFAFVTPESEINVRRQMAKRAEQSKGRFFRGSATYILEQVCKNGSILVTEVVTNTIFDEAENFIGWLGITRDISERTSAEEELDLANRKLKLLSGITRHDINNQVMVLQNCINLLEMRQSDPASDAYLKKANTAAERISAMIRFTHEYESIGINTPVWENCHTLVETATSQIPLGNITVKNDLPAGTEVFADLLIIRVFYNLLDNAVRYGGKITTVRFSVEERGGDHIIVCEDDGVGVPSNEKEQIFKRGFGKNTGLGLFLCREILSITGITVCETGKQGTGARFEITVPHSSIRV